MDKKNENSSAAGRDIPAVCPAAMVDIDRDVPGKTADKICAAPIQTACGSVISSMCIVRGRVNTASTIHMTMPPMRSAMAITHKLSRFLPMTFALSHAGSAVTTDVYTLSLSDALPI